MTFATEGGDPWALSFADWNSDGDLDVATAIDSVGSVSVLLGASVGTRSSPPRSIRRGSRPIPSWPKTSIATGTSIFWRPT
jgi:hypothetical protein